MSVKLFDEDGTIVIRHVSDSNITDHVQPAVYRIREVLMSSDIRLVPDRPKFDVPAKFYGKHNTHKQEILTAFNKAEGATGVLLRGIKGAGKSVLAEDLCNSLLAKYIPVIFVDYAVSPQILLKVVAMIGSCVLYFDEFGKIYNASQRRDLLTFFSDSSFKKVMFIVTSNSKKELDKYMLDRPGRFLFRIDFKGLDPLTICEMLDDHGITGDMAQMLNAYVHHHTVTFDMLRFLIPIAVESGDYLEFNRRIEILNCPPAVYPHMTPTKVLRNGEPHYDYVKMVPSPGRKYTLELKTEAVPEPLYVGEFDMTTRNQIMSESFMGVERQFALDGDVIVLAREEWRTAPQAEVSTRFHDPDIKKEEPTRSRGMMEMDVMGHHMMRTMGLNIGSSLSDEQKQLLALAQHIVDRDKAVAEQPAPAVEGADSTPTV